MLVNVVAEKKNTNFGDTFKLHQIQVRNIYVEINMRILVIIVHFNTKLKYELLAKLKHLKFFLKIYFSSRYIVRSILTHPKKISL